MLSVYRDYGVVPREGRKDNYNKPGEDPSAYRVVRRGDLVLNKMKTWQGSLGISNYEGIVSPAYFVARPLTDDSPAFLHHLLRSGPLIAKYGARSKGIRPSQWDLPWEEFQNIAVDLPAVETQWAVADYLDRETARIDALIAAKRRMVELLEERLRVAISDATDRGTPTSVRRVIILRTTGPRGWGDLAADSGEPFIRSANLRRDDIELQSDEMALVSPPPSQEAARSRTRAGDVLVGVTGANTGWVGIVRSDVANGYVSQHVAILRPSTDLLPEWLAYSLFSYPVQDQLLGGQYGGTKQQLGLEDLADLVIKLPGLEQQRLLVALLERTKLASRNAIRTLSTQSGLLQERRQSLITAAVTGQIDISVAA